MPDIKWIKITTQMFDDEKIRIIEAMPEADTLIVIWIRLICMAGKNNAGGYIYVAEDIPYTMEELATVVNRPLNTVKLAIATYQRLRMIEFTSNGILCLPNFPKYQSMVGLDEIREQTRQRVAAYRDRQKQLQLSPVNGESDTVTDSNVTSNAQNRIDKNNIREDKNRGYLRKNKYREIINRDDPDKFIKGKYGHMVQR